MNAGLADRKMSSIPGPATRINGDLQWQMLYILQRSPADIQRRFELLSHTRRHPGGREQSCSTRIYLVGIMETAQVTRHKLKRLILLKSIKYFFKKHKIHSVRLISSCFNNNITADIGTLLSRSIFYCSYNND